jgi:hypothetical protein
MKKFFRQIGMCLVRVFGSDIRDLEDGLVLGRAFLFSFGGRIHMIGYEGPPLRPACIPQSRIKYWRLTVGFTRAQAPDFPRIDEPS